jgi:glycosyltransferase involved in cell wall biosynthesis
VPVIRIRIGVDAAFRRPADADRPRRLAYMPRKRPEEARQVLGMLRLRGALDGWEVLALDGLSQAEVADCLSECSLFLSFSQLEGFGLPPLEALASGCFVIGYSGFGGQEYFDPRYALEVPDSDVVSLTRTTEQWLRSHPDGITATEASAASVFALSSYGPAQEAADVRHAFDTLAATDGTSRARCIVHQSDLLPSGAAHSWWEDWYRRSRRAVRVLRTGR